jgi:hypothetical protein
MECRCLYFVVFSRGSKMSIEKVILVQQVMSFRDTIHEDVLLEHIERILKGEL